MRQKAAIKRSTKTTVSRQLSVDMPLMHVQNYIDAECEFQFLSLQIIDDFRILAKLIFLNKIILILMNTLLSVRIGRKERSKTQPKRERPMSDLAAGLLQKQILANSYHSYYGKNDKRLDQTHKKVDKDIKQRSPIIKLNKEEQNIFYLNPQLRRYETTNNLQKQKVQIKYVNTLKKIRRVGEKFQRKVKPKSGGFQLQMIKDKVDLANQSIQYDFKKEINRYFRKKIVSKAQACISSQKSMTAIIQRQTQLMQDAVETNRKKHIYSQFTAKRFQTYLRSISTHKIQMPFFVKRKLDDTFDQLQKQEEKRLQYAKQNAKKMEEDSNNSPAFSRSGSPLRNSRITSSSRWSHLVEEYAQDIIEFLEICQFFKRIQHELLRYLPNNHVSNKINTVMDHVQMGVTIRRIYDQCNVDFTYYTPPRIIKILKRQEGILSIMNYIVNIIKLNISAERRKRFKDVEKTISKFQDMTISSVDAISKKMMAIEDQSIKNNIKSTLNNACTKSTGLNPVYLEFVKEAESKEFSQLNSFKSRKTICQILKFQSLMK